MTRIASDPDIGAHGRYGKVYGVIHNRDRDIADAFNDLSRSNALLKLGIMNRLGLITKDEIERFSEETQEWLARLMRGL